MDLKDPNTWTHVHCALGTCEGREKHDSKCAAKAQGDGFAIDDPADFPLGPACDLSGEGSCDSCS